VIITGRDQEALDKASSEIGVIAFVSDQAKLTDITNLIAHVGKHFGKIDGIFFNAGIASFNSIDSFDEEE